MVYRQAVLQKSFDSIGNVKQDAIDTICHKIVDCPHSTPQWVDSGYICLRTTNFKRGYLDMSEKNYVSKDTFDKRNARLIPKSGDVLYSREGAILGIACIIPDNLDVCLGQRMMLFRTNENMLGKYLMYYLNSPKITTFVASKTGGSASPHINVGDIKKFIIPIPDIQTQIKIINYIENYFSIFDYIENIINMSLQQAESLRQSILKKAFKGEL